MLFRFREFPVYIDAKDFRRQIRKIVAEKFPTYEKYQLFDQILRAANSICLNIAEGSNRASDKDFARFLNASSASLEEVVCCLDLALNDGYITIEDCRALEIQAQGLGKQLIGFQKSLKSEK